MSWLLASFVSGVANYAGPVVSTGEPQMNMIESARDERGVPVVSAPGAVSTR